MTPEQKLQDIKANPASHQHTFEALMRCCTTERGVDLRLMEAHQEIANQGTNGGVRCDVSSGPCACGAWH